MGNMSGGGGGGQQQVVQPAPIVYQSNDPYAPNYRPPTGHVVGPTTKAAAPPGGETDEERLARLRRQNLILGVNDWGLGLGGAGTGGEGPGEGSGTGGTGNSGGSGSGAGGDGASSGDL